MRGGKRILSLSILLKLYLIDGATLRFVYFIICYKELILTSTAQSKSHVLLKALLQQEYLQNSNRDVVLKDLQISWWNSRENFKKISGTSSSKTCKSVGGTPVKPSKNSQVCRPQRLANQLVELAGRLQKILRYVVLKDLQISWWNSREDFKAKQKCKACVNFLVADKIAVMKNKEGKSKFVVSVQLDGAKKE